MHNKPIEDPNARIQILEENIQRIDKLFKRGFFRLKFPSDFEMLFQTYFKNEFYTHTKMITLIGLFVFIGFSLIGRFIETNQNVGIILFDFDFWANIIAICLMTLIMRGFDKVRSFFSYIMTISLVLLVVGITKVTATELEVFYFVVVFLMQVYSFVFLRTRIWFSFSYTFTLFLMFVLAYALTDILFKTDDILYLLIFVVVSILALLVEYLIEYYVRYNYLKSQSFIFQAEYLGSINYQLTIKSQTDGLTKLYTKEYFLRELKREWNRAKRQQRPLSVLFIDVDHFKQYNDSSGHIKGDQLLEKIASTLKKYAKRAYDVAARFGGDEFVILYPEINHSHLTELAEKILSDFRKVELGFYGDLLDKKVTLSIGGATIIPNKDNRHESENILLKTADNLLYDAKKNGKNKFFLINLNEKKN